MEKLSSPKIIDLFSGVGGLSLGAARAGFAVWGAVEMNPHALAAHSINFPKASHFLADIKTLSGTGLKNIFRLNDDDRFGIIGGPPCQGFSEIGHQRQGDPRNQLFIHFFRIVSQALPDFFLAENVPGLLQPSNKRLLNSALALVKRSYHLVGPFRASAHEYGAPTTRTRVFIIGYRKSGSIAKLALTDFLAAKAKHRVNVTSALEGLPKKISPDWQDEKSSWRTVTRKKRGYFADRLTGVVPMGVGDPESLRRLRKEKKVSGFLGTLHSRSIERRYGNLAAGEIDPISKSRRLEPDGYCPTLRAGTGPERGSFQAVRPVHPVEARVITPREAARLQGFPDWFQFSPTKWHSFQQIGNSVSPILAERLLGVIARSFNPSWRRGAK